MLLVLAGPGLQLGAICTGEHRGAPRSTGVGLSNATRRVLSISVLFFVI